MLNRLEPEEILKEVPNLEKQAAAVSQGIHDWVLEGGEDRRAAADVLHGTWLGHPLHPVLTDMTIGAWVFGSVLDLLSLTTRSRGVRQAADTLLTLGNVSAVGTALAGITDFSTVPQKAVATGAVHGLLNAGGLILNVISWRNRRRGKRGRGILLTLLAQGVMLVSAWLGGEMVYKYKAGVNRIPPTEGPDDWTAVLDDAELPEGTPKRVKVAGSPVLLYRYQGQVLAMGAVCGHEGAPLEKGSFDGFCVTCPWHQSVYDLRDGSVVHGPTTYAEPTFDVRTLNGKIELRVRANQTTQAATRQIQELSRALNEE